MEITGLNFIGTTRSAKGNRSFKTFNPQLNCQNKWDFFEATSEEINEAVRLAQTAFFALKVRSVKRPYINDLSIRDCFTTC